MKDRRKEKGKQTYEKILWATLELVEEGGLVGLSAGKIAARAKVSKSTLFHHFRMVDEIPMAALELMIHEMMEGIEEKEHANVYDYIVDLGMMIVDSPAMKKWQVIFWTYFNKALHDKSYSALFRDIFQGYVMEIKENLSALVEREIPDEKLQDFAMMVATSVDGICLHFMLAEDKEPIRRAWFHFARVWAHALEHDLGRNDKT